MAQQRNFIDVNGHKWAYLRQGKGEPLIIFHGFMCYADYFIYLIDLLSGWFDVIVPDLPGFGFTPKLAPNTYENITKSAKDFVDTLNLGKVDLFGVSLGGAIALEYAADYPEKVKKLILNSPFWGKNSIKMGAVEDIEFDLLKLPDLVLNILKTKLFFKELANLALTFDPDAKRIFKTHERQTLEAANLMDIDGNRELLYSLLGTDLSDKLKKINKKTLLIAGLSDRVVTPEVNDGLRKIIGGDLVKVKKATHEFVVKSPEKLARIIQDYVLQGKKAQERDFVWE